MAQVDDDRHEHCATPRRLAASEQRGRIGFAVEGQIGATRLPALNRGNAATARRRVSSERRDRPRPRSAAWARSSLRSFAFIEWRWRHPHMPFWTVAPDLSNRWG